MANKFVIKSDKKGSGWVYWELWRADALLVESRLFPIESAARANIVLIKIACNKFTKVEIESKVNTVK